VSEFCDRFTFDLINDLIEIVITSSESFYTINYRGNLSSCDLKIKRVMPFMFALSHNFVGKVCAMVT